MKVQRHLKLDHYMGGNTVYLTNQTVGGGGGQGAGRAGHREHWENPRQFYGDRYEQEEGWEPEQPGS